MEHRPITVATLNYCDIMNNPFEFYCEDYAQELEEISQVFLRMITKYFPDFKKEKFAWGMGKVDQKIRTGRYSPAFSLQVGIQNNAFMNRQEFEHRWDQVFDHLPGSREIEYAESERRETRLYDFILYHTLLAYAFKKDNFDQLIKNSPELYMDIYKPFYELSFLSEEKKLNKFMGSFTKIEADIFFLQEYSPLLVKQIQKTNNYHVVTDEAKDKLIIARKSTFTTKRPPRDLLSEQILESLSWSEGPAILVSDTFIIMNVHLSSKAEKNKPQIIKMKQSLLQLKAKLPNYNIIVGGDVNSFLDRDGHFEKTFNFYPEKESDLTTVKKRTLTQGQFHKGNKVMAESKDKIITSLKIKSGSIRLITNNQAKSKSLIPTDEHPFDHYVVVAYLQYN